MSGNVAQIVSTIYNPTMGSGWLCIAESYRNYTYLLTILNFFFGFVVNP